MLTMMMAVMIMIVSKTARMISIRSIMIRMRTKIIIVNEYGRLSS